jgi:hypothetical protein
LDGFAPKKVFDMTAGFAAALGTRVVVAVILDRDYRTDEEVKKISHELREHLAIVHVHRRKEIENFVLLPDALQRAVDRRIADHVARGGKAPLEAPNVIALTGNSGTNRCLLPLAFRRPSGLAELASG